MNMEVKVGERSEIDVANQINAYMSFLPESQMSRQDKEDIVGEIMGLQRKRFTSVNESMFTKLLKRNQAEQTESDKKVLNNISRSKDPKTQELIKLWNEGKL